MHENMWRGLAGEPQVSEQGSRKKGMWNFPEGVGKWEGWSWKG